MNLIFDLETDGLYDDVTCIHCICIHDLNAKQTFVFNDTGSEQPVVKGVQMLEDASHLIGHNIISYDIPVVRKLFPWFKPEATLLDTLVLSRIYHADRLAEDHLHKTKKWPNLPLQLFGRHSLESYGYRLGEYKGSFGKTTDWKEWSQEMEDYMVQDVNVTRKLWNHFQPYLTGSL
jgi:hypothetical protein